MRPAERRARGRHFLLAERGAVHVFGPALVGRALADDRLAAQQRRPVGDRLRRLERGIDRLHVMAVDVRDDVPAVRREALRRVVGEPALHVAVDRDAVVVVERDELAEPPRAGERAGLVRNAFHQAAVAQEHVRVVIDDRVARRVEFVGEQRFGQRQAHGIGEPLAQRPGGGFDAGCCAGLGMPGRLRMQLPEVAQLRHRQVVTRQVQQRVLQHRAVAVRQHEAVAIRPVRVGRVVAQVPVPQRDGNVRHSHRHAGMARFRRFDGIHRERADCVGKFDIGSAWGRGCGHDGELAEKWDCKVETGGIHIEAMRNSGKLSLHDDKCAIILCFPGAETRAGINALRIRG